jgi:hypothetical protein
VRTLVEIGDKMPNIIDLSPGKDVYQSAAADVHTIDAVKELVDNALDNWTRMSQRADNLTIEIEANNGRTRVQDNSGGLDPDRIHTLFALGRTFQDEIPTSIGAYGIGAKKAIMRLANINGEGQATVKSHARGEGEGVGFSIDAHWMASDAWTVEQETFDMDEGSTVVDVGSGGEVWTDERVEDLKQALSTTYQRFLGGEATQGGGLSIVVNGEELGVPDATPYSFTPFDGMHPRRYEGIELQPEGVEQPIEMDVTVGLMAKADAQHAGVDWYCQDRLVIEGDRSEASGFGEVRKGGMGSWTAHHNRLHVVVELRTEGNTALLPWGTTKNSIDPYDRVTRAVQGWLKRIVKPYYRLNTNRVPRAFVEPYTSEHPDAANQGVVDVLDYAGYERVVHKPDTDTPRVKTVEEQARLHAEEGVRYYGDLDAAEEEAYEQQLRMFHGEDVDEMPIVDRFETDDTAVIDQVGIGEITERVPGFGEKKAERLMGAGYETLGDVHNVTAEALTEAQGIGMGLATRIHDAVEVVYKEQEPAQVAEQETVSVTLEFERGDYEELCDTIGVESGDPERVSGKLVEVLTRAYGALA